LGSGHVQAECTNVPVCYKCKEKGHMAVDCNVDSKKLKMYGFGVPGQGFYAMNFPEATIKTHQNTGLLIILAGEASEEKVDKELKHLVRDGWDFKVKQIHLQEYLVVFPDKTSLDTFTKLSEFQMSLYGLKGKLEKTAREFDTSSLLQTIWVKVHGIPDLVRDVESIKEIAGLVVEPLVIDELSIIKEEHVRVQGRCRNPGAIKGAVEIFFNGIGKLIRFEVEGGKQRPGKGGKGGPPGSDKPDDRTDKDRDKSSKDEHAKKSLGKFDRVGQIDKEMDPNQEDSMVEDIEKIQDGNNGNTFATPLAAFHPGIGMVNIDQKVMTEADHHLKDKVDLDMEVGEKGPDPHQDHIVESMDITAASQILVHGRDGEYLLDRCMWPKLLLPGEKEMQENEEGEGLTQEDSLLSTTENMSDLHFTQDIGQKKNGCAEDLMDNASIIDKDSEGENGGQGWQASKVRKARKPKRVVMATRTSSRVPRDGVPIATKAAQRVMTKNTRSGTNKNSFTILNNCPNSILQAVISDLNLEMGNVDMHLDAFKTEELARAKIAEANYNSFLEKQKQKTAPQTEEEELDLTMGVISNDQRDFHSVTLKGRENGMDSSMVIGAEPIQNLK
jgi:hypothetical protein